MTVRQIRVVRGKKCGMWNSFKYRKHLWQERVVRGVAVLCYGSKNELRFLVDLKCVSGTSQ